MASLRLVAEVVLAAACVPTIALLQAWGIPSRHPDSLWPQLGEGIERMTPLPLLLAPLLLGTVARTLPSRLGPCFLLVPFVLTVADVVTGRGGHDLWPLELAWQGALVLAAIVLLAGGRWLRASIGAR